MRGTRSGATRRAGRTGRLLPDFLAQGIDIDDVCEREATLADGAVIQRRYRAWCDAEKGLEHTDDRDQHSAMVS